jgi:hypothetical protein
VWLSLHFSINREFEGHSKIAAHATLKPVWPVEAGPEQDFAALAEGTLR